MRWSEFLTKFNFRIKYRPGTLNTIPDALSRKPGDVPVDETDDRLRARRRPLINPDRFDPGMYDDCTKLTLAAAEIDPENLLTPDVQLRL